MTRGILIGEIVDSLSNLNNQINIRCSLGFTDLNKVSEDFFAKLLNKIYSYSLINLNSSRSNEPGIDIGDETNSIAFQVTSQADSSKINSTFEKITQEQKKKFKLIKILIIGEKQGSYTAVKPELIDAFKFTKDGKSEPEDFIDFNIIDIKTLLRDIISLDFKLIHTIYKFIKEEIQDLIIELEIPRADGKFPTSLLSHREIKPETRALNAKKILDLNEFEHFSLKEINDYFDKLTAITRVTREIYFFIIDEGKWEDDTFSIYYDDAIRILNINPKRLESELKILERKKLIFDRDEEEPKLIIKEGLDIGSMLWFIKRDMNLQEIIINLDFTKLDD
ncbi:hypothetical protein FLA105534_04289 [Flavobacterium bizetiae]|uniref:SMEK domain-containing protein n=1 Tax=Flavobacterium bizetiae TaxID=2704140 RepID=A0A6J4GZN6_9FLAO|nr:SMEK domain-containing protein [Flavobacterium bizetiae]CAA9202865.1 hypothetical protein FLA105534_04289 [Flavobacterium bizetiae]CAD5343571.1 hypothetical protein FLA105535_03570 [Flavobacterium bizetiae]CAD5349566.1 hypothetical protein FLA105534_03551 [Flavobacterium bizetiae]